MFEQFKEAFLKYDSFWMYSDDFKVIKKGTEDAKTLEELVKNCTKKELEEFLTQDVIKKVYGNRGDHEDQSKIIANSWIKRGKDS